MAHRMPTLSNLPLLKLGIFKGRGILFYPLVVATYPVAFLYGENAREAFRDEVIGTWAVVIAATLLVTLLLRLFIKDNTKVAAAMSVLLVVFFSYGLGRNLLFHKFQISIAGVLIGQEPYLSRIMAVIALLAASAVILYRGNLARLVQVGALMALVLILYNVGRIVVDTSGAPGDITIDGQPVNTIPIPQLDVDSLPDIYYIIVDAYSRADEIQRNFGYDNSQFIDSLESKGFFVASESRSNYSHTFASTAATLSMRYLDGEDGIRLVNEVPVAQFLRKFGYQYVHVSSGRSITKRNSRADIELFDASLSRFVVNDFSSALLDWTMAAPLADQAGVNVNAPFVENKVKSLQDGLRWLRSIPDYSGPTFTLSHFLPLHSPYIFDRDGNVRPNATKLPDLEEGKQLYVDQLVYTNKELDSLVEDILSRSSPEPIIIIQGDHASWGDPWTLYFAPDQLWKRTAIFNAYYLPERCRSGLYPSISPVNSFRVVLNSCLGTNLEILPAEHYDEPYRPDGGCYENTFCGPDLHSKVKEGSGATGKIRNRAPPIRRPELLTSSP